MNPPRTVPFDPMNRAELSDWLDYRTLAATGDGNPFGTWAGRKGVITLSSTGTERLTYVADDGDGRAAASADGVDDHMDATIDNFTLYGSTGDFEQWGVVKGLSSGAGTRGLWVSGGITQSNTVLAQTNPRLLWYCPTGGDLAISGAVDVQNDAWHVVRLVRNGSSRLFYVDGVLISTSTGLGAGWTSGLDSFNLGLVSGVFWLGSIRHCLFFTSLLDTDTADELLTYLQTA